MRTLSREAAPKLVATPEGEAEKTLRVCFVCTGNTCRSPMAEAVANALAQEQAKTLSNLLDGEVPTALEAHSAGLFANEGEPIAPNAVQALEEAGIPALSQRSYRAHLAHNLSEREAGEYSLLIGMTSAHAMQLILRFPQYASRITHLPKDIPDPYGGDREVYRRALEEITQGVQALLFAGGAE